MGKNLKIGVVFGGPSSEHEISIMTGRHVLQTLLENGYDAHQIYITTTGNWLLNNSSRAYDPAELCVQHDLMFNAMHGEFGEDGQLQQIFEHCNVPYTGSTVVASALAMNKVISREIFKNVGLVVPRAAAFSYDTFDIRSAIPEVMMVSAPPWLVKPASRGSSIGISLVQTYDKLLGAFEYAFSFDHNVLVEEYINGREVTCGVLDNFEGEKHYALHPLEIIPPPGRFFDSEVRYTGLAKQIPVSFFGEMLRKIKDTARTSHTALGCRQYSRTDMIVKGTKVYVLETNTLPGLTKESLLPRAAEISRVEFPKLLDHIIDQAIIS